MHSAVFPQGRQPAACARFFGCCRSDGGRSAVIASKRGPTIVEPNHNLFEWLAGRAAGEQTPWVFQPSEAHAFRLRSQRVGERTGHHK